VSGGLVAVESGERRIELELAVLRRWPSKGNGVGCAAALSVQVSAEWGQSTPRARVVLLGLALDNANIAIGAVIEGFQRGLVAVAVVRFLGLLDAVEFDDDAPLH
jgi:hypothetical protein